MGKVIINGTDATKTASSGSRATGMRENERQRAHVDLSRKTTAAEGIGVKMSSNKGKSVANRGGARPAPKSRQLPSGSGVKKSGKSEKVTSAVIAVRKPVPKNNKPKTNIKQLGSGEIKRERTIDPEIALMENRAAAAETTRVDITKVGRKGGRSMSGMVVETVRPGQQAGRMNLNGKVVSSADTTKKTKPESEQLSKAKSVLVGVGVALVVAVIGFAGIALFGDKKNMCTVNFESNGGSQVEGAEIVCGRTVKRPEDPTKEGFSFEGWILEGDPFDFETGIYKNSTLVAKWKADEGTEVVVVKFDTDGGSKIDDIEVAKGKKVSIPTAPTKMGYVFEDWYLGDEVYDFSKPVEENITLKARWERREGSGNNNTATTSKRATSIAVAESLNLKVGGSQQLTVTVLPAAAEYTLSAVSSNDEVASCTVNKNLINCSAKKAGNATIRIRDSISGQMAQLAISVTDDLPAVDPGEEKPPVVDPGEENPVTPPAHTHVDKDNDGKCDVPDCNEPATHTHTAPNADGKCDDCGAQLVTTPEPDPGEPEEGGPEA